MDEYPAVVISRALPAIVYLCSLLSPNTYKGFLRG